MFKDLKAIYDNTRIDIFAMAITYVVDIGWRNAKKLTDKEIADMQGNGLMTQAFVQMLMKSAREIANTVENPTEIIQFCDAMNIYETRCYTTGECLDRATLEHIARKLLEYTIYTDFDVPNDEDGRKENMAGYLDIEVDDIDSLLERG